MSLNSDATFILSGFADEIAADLDTQLDVFEELGLGHIDLRSVDGTNILDLTEKQLVHVRNELNRRDIKVASIGSPIGKIDITDAFEPHRERFEHALDIADFFETEYIRLFSYWIPEREEPADHREEVLHRMETKVDLAEEMGITLLHENEKDIYGDTPARCRDLLTTINSSNFRAIFDPANFLETGCQPYPDALLDLIEYVEYLHIKDAEFGQRGAIRPAGDGDGRIPEILGAFKRRGYIGYAALEPHLAHAGEKGGFSGPEAFDVATDALRACMDQVDCSYE
ncbi:sugar phosphate isomerase/epimerase family protein [Halocatena marina]|uniref:Sugar phosphate isomerase/epimerase family protein n=1 Tax=Halocatena marina TaxID=2934937 RepID=A0ABD5YJZ4_9EURY|nr:TIM barrel protein [Halocatena marina]